MLSYLCLGLAALSAVSANCCFDVNADLPKAKAPLILQGEELLLPEPSGKTGQFCVKTGDAITLACPGAKNQLAASKSEAAEATCVGQTKVKVGSKTAALSTLDCSKAAGSVLIPTEESCAKDGKIMKIGFEVNGKFQQMVTVCHQIEEGNTLYAQHTISKNIDGAVVESKRPSFTRGDKILYKGYDPNNGYKQTNQKEVFTKALGKDKTEELMNISFLARGHLAPDADFMFGSWQWSTYFYANAAPQWQSFNAGNWLAYEKLCRKLASLMKSDLNIITGTYGILTLPNANGVATPLYLEGNKKKMPIPDVMWKILQDPATNKAIAIVGSNNILLENPEDTLCKDICESNGWTTLTDVKKGYMYCCSVDDLRKVVDTIPAMKVSGILQGPKSF